jgi:uncharacterized membrane protein (DUF485 family)
MSHPRHSQKINSALFQKLLNEKKKFIVPVTLLYLSFYFSLPILTSYFPELANIRVWGYISVAWVLLFAQFAMTGIVCILYVWKARSFDQLSAEIMQNEVQKNESPSESKDGSERI